MHRGWIGRGSALVAAARRRVWLLETLHQVYETIVASDDIEGSLQQITEEIYARFQFDSVAMGVVEGDVIFFRGMTFQALPSQLELSIYRGICGRVVRSGIAELVSDVERDPDYQPANTGVRSELVAPIPVDGAVWGVLNVEAGDGVPIGAEELDVMRTLATSLGLAIEASRRRIAERRRLDQMSALTKITGIVAGRPVAGPAAKDVLGEVARVLDVQGVTLGFVTGDEIRVYRTYANRLPDEVPVAVMSISDGITGRVVRTSDSAFVTDTASDPDFIALREGVAQEICVPIRVFGQVVAVITIEQDDRRTLDAGDFDLVQTLADHISLAMANQQRIEELERRNQQLRAVERVTEVIASVPSIRDTMPSVLEEMERAFGFGASAIGLIEDDHIVFPAIEHNLDEEGRPDHLRRYKPGCAVRDVYADCCVRSGRWRRQRRDARESAS